MATGSPDPGFFEDSGRSASHGRRVRRFLRGAVDPDRLSTAAGEKLLKGALLPLPAVGDRIGQFTLRRLIGQGSFGAVFEAEQDAPVRRRVAVKVLSESLHSERAERRFDAERRALASLSHSGIAAILDGGVSVGGVPWFAMELVDGEPIDRFCEQRKLPPSQRIALLRQACEAVEFAHRRGVLHRDLKPGNVLVQSVDGAGPRVKVIDFGLAKIIEGDEDEGVSDDAGSDGGSTAGHESTHIGQAVGTPAYMSPEAASLEPWRIDARSDVFALAAIGVRLLTGAPPHVPVEGEPDDAYLSRVRERPVASIDERLKRVGAPRWRDLAAVLGKGLSHAPESRYQSAADLADDLDRWDGGFPVNARAVGAAGRAWRLASRHPVASSVIVLLAAAISVSLVFAMRQARLAAERQADAEARAESMRVAVEPLLDAVQLSALADDSIEARSRLVRAFDEVFGPDHPKTNTRRLQLATTLRGARRFNEAIAEYGVLLGVAERAGLRMESKGAQRILGDYADTLRMKGDVERARAIAEECVFVADHVNGGCDGNFQQARLALAAMMLEAGDAAGAERHARCAVELLATCQPEATGQRVIAESLWADTLFASGDAVRGRAVVDGLRGRAGDLVAGIPTLGGVAREWEAQRVLEEAEALKALDPGGAAMAREAEALRLEEEVRRRPPVVDRLRGWRDSG
jgi:serine/threonine protein kinase